MHKLVTGLFYPQLQRAFVDTVEIYRSTAALRPLLVLVRGELLADHLRRLLNRELPGTVGISFLTLKEIAGKISVGNSPQAIYHLNSSSQEALILKISKQRVPPEDHFGRMLSMPGFARSLTETIDELKNAAVSPRQLQDLADEWINPKLRTLADIYTAYTRYLKSKALYDNADILQQAATVYHNRRWPGDCPLLLYGFWKLSLLERRLLEKLIEHRVSYAFIPFAAQPVFKPVISLLRWFEQHGFERCDLGVQADLPSQLHKLRQPVTDVGEATEKKHAGPTAEQKKKLIASEDNAQCAMPYGPVKPEQESEVVIFSVSDECQESQVLAREIMTIAASGRKFEEIAVILGAGSYSGYLTDTLAGRGIPFHLAEAPLHFTREGQLALAILRVFVGNFSRQTVCRLAYLLSASPSGPISAVWPAEWSKLAQDIGISSGVNQWTRQLQKFIVHCLEQETSARSLGTGGDYSLVDSRWREMAESLLAFIELLDDWHRRLQRSSGYRDFIDNFLAFYTTVCPITSDRRQVEQALSTLGQLDLLELAPIISEFLAMACQALKANQHRPDISSGRVWIGELAAAVGLAFPVVIVSGMSEKEFTIITHQVTLLQDRERAMIDRRLMTNLTRGSDRTAEEKLLYQLTITAASRRLYLSYPRIDTSSDKQKLPASLLLETAATILGHSVNYYSLETCYLLRRSTVDFYLGQEPSAAAWPMIYDLASLHRLLADRNDIPTALARQYPFFAITQENMRRRWQKGTFGCFDGVIGDSGLRNILRRYYSPCAQTAVISRLLETYASCPLRFFMKYVLRLVPAKKVSLLTTVSYRQQKRIVVDILAALATQSALAREQDDGHDLDQNPPACTSENAGNRVGYSSSEAEYNSKNADSEADYASKNAESDGMPNLPPLLKECAQATFAHHRPEVEEMLWEVEQEKVIEKLAYYLQTRSSDSLFSPLCFKLVYGESAGLGPKLTLDNPGTIYFTGYFDQINVDAARNNVEGIHYLLNRLPSGSKDNRFYGGEQLQLAVDVLALSELFPEYQVWRSAYRYLDDRGLTKEISFYGNDQSQTREQLIAICRMIVGGIENGLFFPFPGQQKCRFCPYLEACGANRQQIYDYKQDDPRIEFFHQLKQID